MAVPGLPAELEDERETEIDYDDDTSYFPCLDEGFDVDDDEDD